MQHRFVTCDPHEARNIVIHLNRKHHTQISPRLQSVLQQIVDDVVNRLGCLGALGNHARK